MKRALFIGYFWVFIVASAQTRTEYYLTKQDFLSGNSVQYQEVRRHSYIEATFSKENQLESLKYFNDNHQIKSSENYEYTDQNSLKKKQTLNENNLLVEETIFGEEENALRFIQYDMDVKIVKRWGDRFTITSFLVDDGKPIVHKFYDVDGKYYGNIGYMYDDTGYRTEEVWINEPSKQIIRRWKYQFIPETNLHETKEYDQVGKLIQHFLEDSTGKEEVLQFIKPMDHSVAVDGSVSYLLINDLLSGRFLWTQKDLTGNSIDSISFQLSSSLKKKGLYTDVSTIGLVDGATYELKFTGISKREKEGISKTVFPVKIDYSPPKVSLDISPFLSDVKLAYETNEPLAFASVNFVPLSEDNTQKPVIILLESDEINQLKTEPFLPVNQVPLIDGMEYAISMTCSDIVGNQETNKLNYPVRCDKTDPSIFIHSPSDSTILTSLDLNFEFSEKMKNTEISVISNKELITTIHLEESLLDTGKHILTIPLKDSTDYDIHIYGEDIAGNLSDTSIVHFISIDYSPPIISVHSPKEKEFINKPLLSYTLSEDLAFAQVELMKDSVDSTIIRLKGEELLKGEYLDLSFDEVVDLEENCKYTVVIKGEDFAGNQSEEITIKGVEYDITNPVAEITSPNFGSSVSSLNLDLSISETLKTGHILWIDLEKDSLVYNYNLSDIIINTDDTLSITLSDTLISGLQYVIKVVGKDFAGNGVIQSNIPVILYDNSLPEIAVSFPKPNERLNQIYFEYELSEDMTSSEIEWRLTSDNSVIKSYHLQDEFLLSGKHRLELKDYSSIIENTPYNIYLFGKDKAGNECETEIGFIRYDFTPPTISILNPTDSSFINHSNVAYSLSESLNNGKVIWTSLDENDSSIVVEQILKDINLMKGNQNTEQLSFVPNLMNGFIYSAQITGEDSTGNTAVSNKIDNIIYDIETPVLDFISPVDSTILSNPVLKWNLSESLAFGVLLFHSGDILDSIPLDHNILSMGDNVYMVDSSLSAKLEGQYFTVQLYGKDHAGNQSSPITVSNLFLDTTPPVVEFLSPRSNEIVNQISVTINNNEDLLVGEVVLNPIGIANDNLSSTFSLTENQLQMGNVNFEPFSSENLKDSTYYQITYKSADLAKNSSNTAIIDSLYYDVSPPIFEIVNLVNNKWIRSTNVHYRLSERLKEGIIHWIDQDTNEYIDVPLTLLTKQDGFYELDRLNQPKIRDGHSYTVVMSGTDLAGNIADPIEIKNLYYDITPPVFSEFSISDSVTINLLEYQYKISEDLMSGGVEYYHQGQLIKTSPFSDHNLLSGYQTFSVGSDSSIFTDGNYYDIAFFGQDSAGNLADTVTISNILYDVTPPKILISGLNKYNWINSVDFTFTISEELTEGKIHWKDLITLEEFTIDLGSEAIKAGKHSIQDIEIPRLIDGNSYSLQIYGTDLAGNLTESSEINPFYFDTSPPVFSHLSFTENSYINDAQFSYAVSEPLSKGWMKVKSNNDESTVLDLLESQIDIPLIDGGIYDISFFGSDSAGNVSDTLSVNNVFYDVSPPALIIVSPIDSTLNNDFSITYSTNEPLLEGAIIWVHLTDTIRYNIEESNLNTGEQFIVIEDVPIKEDVEYMVFVRGVDRAGNIDTSLWVGPVFYDLSNPTVTNLQSIEELPINTIKIEYQLSEDLSSGSIQWIVEDTLTHPVVNYVLKNEELHKGEHSLDLDIQLLDGINYYPQISGEDLAGNQLLTSIEGFQMVRYDRQKPLITVISPQDSTYINKLDIQYELSETLISGEIIFENKNNPSKTENAHKINLKGSRLQIGRRGGILPISMIQIQNGSTYDISFVGVDSAGNFADTVMTHAVYYDDVGPVINLMQPSAEQAINKPYIEYTLSETLKEGRCIFTPSGEVIDEILSREFHFTSEWLEEGSHFFDLSESIQLTEGVTYTIGIDGIDLAGNTSMPVNVENVIYDTTPPILTINSPVNEQFINHMQIEIIANEKLKEGELTVSSGEESISILLNENEKNSGELIVDISNRVKIINGEPYSITLSGMDFADNRTDTVQIHGVVFDTIAPVLSVLRPINSEIISEESLDYICSEQMKSLNVKFIRTAGNIDPNSPHTIPIIGDGLSKGQHTDIKLSVQPELLSGSIYIMQLYGEDFAGNSSNIFEVTSLIIDKDPPIFNFTSPKPDTILNQITFGFTVTEDLISGTCILSQTGGVEDSKSPHQVLLPREMLTEGLHSHVQFPSTNLQSESVYSISILGEDLAGNKSDTTTVRNIAFDNIKPEVVLESPETESLIIDPIITYQLSEDVVSARAVWSNGTKENGFVYEVDLTSEEMVAGRYDEIILQNQVPIFLGLPFELSMTATDLAGNVSDPVAIPNITFTRLLDGEWKYAGILMEVSLTFDGDEDTESRTGTMEMDKKMGSKIDEKIEGNYTIDYSKKPWRMDWELSNGEKKRCIFEFTSINQLRIVIGDKVPKNWNDGELLFFVFLSDEE